MMLNKKSCIWETLNISTCADSSTCQMSLKAKATATATNLPPANSLSISKLELIPGGGLQPSDISITEYYRYLNAHKDYNPWFKWSALICRSNTYNKKLDILSNHQYIVSNVNPLSKNVMIYCLNLTHHLFKTGSRRLKLFNVCAIPATIWSLVFYISKSVKICLLRPLLEVLVLIVCRFCDLSGIWDKGYLSL